MSSKLKPYGHFSKISKSIKKDGPMNNKFFSLAEIAAMTNSKLMGDPEYLVSNVSDLESATADDASFLANPRYEQAMKQSKAGVIFVTPSTELSSNKNYLINEDPSRAFQITLEAFHSNAYKLTGFNGIHKSAVIHETCELGTNLTVGPNAVVDNDVKIGDNSFIGAGVYLGPGVVVGNDCLIHPNVTIREGCVLGNNVIIQPGAVIGSCGFGYLTDKTGKHSKLKQVGNVTIGDNVEVGANTTIDRSRFRSTSIDEGTKIDNQVQIAHGVKIGKDNIIVAQVGMAGSCETGRNVVLAGQVGISGHIKLHDGVVLAAKAGASKSITKPGNYSGAPAVPLEEYNRNKVYLRNVEKFVTEIGELKKRLEKLETTPQKNQ